MPTALVPAALAGVLLASACGSSTAGSAPTTSATTVSSTAPVSSTNPTSSTQPSGSPTPGASTSSVSGSVCAQHPAWSADSAQALPITVPEATIAIPARRLVPDARPTAMTVCQYHFDMATRQATLTVERRVSNPATAQARLAAETPLGGRPEHCTMMSVPVTGYLARLDYAQGSVWVGVAGFNACNGTTNGHTVSVLSDARNLQQAAETGTWPA